MRQRRSTSSPLMHACVASSPVTACSSFPLLFFLFFLGVCVFFFLLLFYVAPPSETKREANKKMEGARDCRIQTEEHEIRKTYSCAHRETMSLLLHRPAPPPVPLRDSKRGRKSKGKWGWRKTYATPGGVRERGALVSMRVSLPRPVGRNACA